MLISINFKMALSSLRSSRWRSLFTMLGVVIGIVSVVTTVSIGEGIKRQITNQINQAGTDLITVRPGHMQHDASNGFSSASVLATFGGATFNQADFQTVAKTPGLADAASFSLVNGIPKIDTLEYDQAFVVATTDNLAKILNLKIAYGNFFSDHDNVKDGAVIGQRVAEQLFKENVPIGKTFTIRDQTFRVRGVIDEVMSSPLVPYSNYNDAVFIPDTAGALLNGGPTPIYQIVVKPEPRQQMAADLAITHSLSQAHAGQNDFTVLKGTQTFAAANHVLQMLTTFITSVAAVSLIVGGIGIMNIMLVSVTERTREIGIRKAVGATNRQILIQFLMEATVLSVVGGLIGIGLSFIVNYLLRVLTSLQPAISLPIIGMASGVAVLVGIVFGIAPAIKAARKDPIEALRSI